MCACRDHRLLTSRATLIRRLGSVVENRCPYHKHELVCAQVCYGSYQDVGDMYDDQNRNMELKANERKPVQSVK